MEKQQMNEIIEQELRKVYKLCTYAPSPTNWDQFLEMKRPMRKKVLTQMYNWETAWQRHFPYTHWYLQLHHKEAIDKMMEMVLLPEVYQHYLKLYPKKVI